MEFKLLGPLEVVLDTGEPPTLARARERCLLAVLLMHADQTLSMGKLISCVRDDDQGMAEGTFRAYLSHVKSVIDATSGQAQLVTREGGYQLRVPPDCVDVHRFTRLRRKADAAVRVGDTEQAIALLCEAEALWRGPALGGLNGQWAEATRTGLDEERRACTLKRIGLELGLGRHDELLGELRRLAAQYPFDETRAGYEMTALYRSGRQTEALDAYRQVRARLLDQGIDPRPELVRLHQRILNQDPELSQPDIPRKPPSAAQPTGVPVPATGFVGRAEEIRALTATGPGTPQVRIISGLSGTGKTALAVESARRLADGFPDGWLYLEFHAHKEDHVPLDADGALRSLLEMTGARRPALPHGSVELTALWQQELATRQMVIVLDDVPDVGSVMPLLPQDGSCRVLITARRRLHGITGASELTLGVLPEPEAITLFNQIAGADKDSDPDTAATAVRRCGCLPIAITLTASRLRESGGLPDAAESSDGIEDLCILSTIARTGKIGEQLLLILEGSYQALTTDEQRLFRFLGMNPCLTFTTESAAAITDTPVHMASALIGALLDRHFVQHSADGGFKLHDMLRDYSVFRAKQDVSRHDRRGAERRLLGYYLYQADRADRDLYPHRRRAPLQAASQPSQRPGYDPSVDSRKWLEVEWRNTLMIAEYAGRHEWKRHCAELAHILAEFLIIRGYWDEAADAHSCALRACRDLGDRSWTARALLDLSRVCQRKGLREDALAHAQDALDTYRIIENIHGEAAAADRIGLICYYSGRLREALAYGREARSLYAQSGDLLGEAEAVSHCGVACAELGRLSESLNYFQESLVILEHSGNLQSMARALNSLGEVSLRQGYHRGALDYYQRTLAIFRSMGAYQESAIAIQNIGHVYLYKGDPERALLEFRCALAAFRRIKDIPWQARAMCDCGDAYLAMDDYEQCLVYYQQAASMAAQIGNLYVQVVAQRGTADAYRESDRHEEALHCYQDTLKIAQEVGEPYQQAVILDGIAKTMFRLGNTSTGRVYLRQACDLYQAAGAAEAKTTELRLQMLGDLPADGNSSIAASA